MMKRAHNDDQKAERRSQIVRSSAELWSRIRYEDLTLKQIADSLGLVKGTLYRYFPTKEALAIEVLEHELTLWTQSLGPLFERKFPSQASELSRQIAQIFVDSFAPRRLMLHLFSILNTSLEPKLDDETLTRFKTLLLACVQHGAQTMETYIPAMQGKAADFFFSLYALTIGCIHVGLRSEKIDRVLEEENLEPFRIDFETFLASNLRSIVISTLTSP